MSNSEQSARFVRFPIPVEDTNPQLEVTDEHGETLKFHCENCRSFWIDCDHPDKNPGHSRTLGQIERNLRRLFKESDRFGAKWKKLWKIAVHILTGNDIGQDCLMVVIKLFGNQTFHFTCIMSKVFEKSAGPIFTTLRRSSTAAYAKMLHGWQVDDNTVSDLTSPEIKPQMQRLVRKAGVKARDGRSFVSWFAGHMSAQSAHERLRDKPEGTYLVRLSQTRADEGAFVVAVKTDSGEIRQYMIMGKPARMDQDDDGENSDKYNNRFHLFINNAYEDECYPNLIKFIEQRCKYQDIEDGVSCRRICENLPLNADFTGYR